MSNANTAEDRCRGVLVGLAACGRIGGPIRMAVRLAESLLDCGDFNPADILKALIAAGITARNWFEGKTPYE